MTTITAENSGHLLGEEDVQRDDVVVLWHQNHGYIAGTILINGDIARVNGEGHGRSLSYLLSRAENFGNYQLLTIYRDTSKLPTEVGAYQMEGGGFYYLMTDGHWHDNALRIIWNFAPLNPLHLMAPRDKTRNNALEEAAQIAENSQFTGGVGEIIAERIRSWKNIND